MKFVKIISEHAPEEGMFLRVSDIVAVQQMRDGRTLITLAGADWRVEAHVSASDFMDAIAAEVVDVVPTK